MLAFFSDRLLVWCFGVLEAAIGADSGKKASCRRVDMQDMFVSFQVSDANIFQQHWQQ